MSTQGQNPRFSAIQTVISRRPKTVTAPTDERGNTLKISDFYGVNTFSLKQMKQKLPNDIYKRLIQTTQTGKKLDQDVATAVAHAVKEWALENGVTHYCHWFQPQTGATAEKHDAFMTIDGSGQPIERFSGAQLIQSEPDASSFPSGGMRTTFEARGYTAWDPTSPIFISESGSIKTLCIPSVFISYHGDALDEKTGVLRSNEALSERAVKLLHIIGDTDVKAVTTSLGPEQEYFLIDRSLYALRPDLIMSGRTLVGARPPRGQQLEDHYFGSIPARVLAFMTEVEQELFKLGVPAKTRHNEVAPMQFELAPIYEEANVAIDHNHVTMETMRQVAKKHDFEVLFHEKPFAGVNGSGKHNNWSMSVSQGGAEIEGMNLLDPGKTPHQNLRFLLFLSATLKGVNKHAGLLRAAIASSGNDHRLGANEAPPAIISVFLGNMLDNMLNEIEKDAHKNLNYTEAVIALGVSKLPTIMKDNTDRNRTSPFAFTGNKFEFRAVGASASCALPITFLNAAVADGIQEVTALLEASLKTTKVKEEAIFAVVKDVIKESKQVRFEGNGYSGEWVSEADKRSLPHLKTTPDALHQIVSEKSIKLLTGLGVFSENEIKSRFHVRIEIYNKKVLIEAETMKSIVETIVLPAAYQYMGTLASGIAASKEAGVAAPSESLIALNKTLATAQTELTKLGRTIEQVYAIEDEEKRAAKIAVDLKGAMESLREQADTLEGQVADHFWPLPKYREMLFLS
ncbi:MAG: glutamine synthetase III [Bdellovibrionales bacterium]|nr:glutamine synthetase III [Bdellovibrionales bacterium]